MEIHVAENKGKRKMIIDAYWSGKDVEKASKHEHELWVNDQASKVKLDK